MKIVIIGGTGLIGTKTVDRLRRRGHEVIAASPDSGVDTISGAGVAEALVGAQVVVDLANSPSFEDEAVLEFLQPIAADDVADAMADVALAAPANGTLEIAGPERARLDDLVRRFLSESKGSHEVVTDPMALYFGVRLDDRSLVPGDDARIGTTRFEDWLGRAPRR